MFMCAFVYEGVCAFVYEGVCAYICVCVIQVSSLSWNTFSSYRQSSVRVLISVFVYEGACVCMFVCVSSKSPFS